MPKVTPYAKGSSGIAFRSGASALAARKVKVRDIEALLRRYPAREEKMVVAEIKDAIQYQGITFRGDDGWAKDGQQSGDRDYVFRYGFRQSQRAVDNQGKVDLDLFMGRTGETGPAGISTSTSLEHAEIYSKTNIYIIDLSEHPMAFSVSKMGDRQEGASANGSDYLEVNVANGIDNSFVVGHYNPQTEIFTPNPNYSGRVILP
ncbi:MAG: hypothetical protein ACRC5A_08395 [Enterobacteriaceae bacterium]